MGRAARLRAQRADLPAAGAVRVPAVVDQVDDVACVNAGRRPWCDDVAVVSRGPVPLCQACLDRESSTSRLPLRPAVVAREPLPADSRTVLARLRRVQLRQAELERAQEQLVRQARAAGVPWAEIGRVLGRTGQAVSMRYGGAQGSGGAPPARPKAEDGGPRP